MTKKIHFIIMMLLTMATLLDAQQQTVIPAAPPAQQQSKQPTVPAQQQIPQQQKQPAMQSSPNLPLGFFEDGVDADTVTVGSRRDGTIEAWKIGDGDSALYRYDETSTAPNAWVKQMAKDETGALISAFDDVAASSEGIICAVSSTGKVYTLDSTKNIWEEIPANNADHFKFAKITVGNGRNIWAIEKATNNIYQLVVDYPIKIADATILSNEWVLKSRNGIDISAGIDGTVVAVSSQNNVYRFANNTWIQIPNIMLSKVAVASKDLIWGIYENGPVSEFWKFIPDLKTPTWQKIKNANGQDALTFTNIAANASGTIFATDAVGTIYNNGDKGVVMSVVTPEQLKLLQPGQFIQLARNVVVMPPQKISNRWQARQANLIQKIQQDPALLEQKQKLPKKLKVAPPVVGKVMPLAPGIKPALPARPFQQGMLPTTGPITKQPLITPPAQR